jgi:hypothetical protein
MLSAQEVSDRLEILDLFARYCRAVDERDWDLLWTVFLPSSVIDYSDAGGLKAAAPEAIEWLSAAMGSSAFSQHVVTLRDIELLEDTATILSYYYNPTGRQDSETDFSVMLVGGYYRDRLKRTDDGWRISGRRVDKLWQTPRWQQTEPIGVAWEDPRPKVKRSDHLGRQEP